MKDWMRTDWDFATPCAWVQVSMRSEAGQELRGILSNDPNRDKRGVQLLLNAFVVRRNPNLKGCSVVAVRLSYSLRMELLVLHPSFEPVQDGAEPLRVMLEVCPRCGQGVSSFPMRMRYLDQSDREVCSERCAAHGTAITLDPASGKDMTVFQKACLVKWTPAPKEPYRLSPKDVLLTKQMMDQFARDCADRLHEKVERQILGIPQTEPEGQIKIRQFTLCSVCRKELPKHGATNEIGLPLIRYKGPSGECCSQACVEADVERSKSIQRNFKVMDVKVPKLGTNTPDPGLPLPVAKADFFFPARALKESPILKSVQVETGLHNRKVCHKDADGRFVNVCGFDTAGGENCFCPIDEGADTPVCQVSSGT